jgi:hypothetical protein
MKKNLNPICILSLLLIVSHAKADDHRVYKAGNFNSVRKEIPQVPSAEFKIQPGANIEAVNDLVSQQILESNGPVSLTNICSFIDSSLENEVPVKFQASEQSERLQRILAAVQAEEKTATLSDLLIFNLQQADGSSVQMVYSEKNRKFYVSTNFGSIKVNEIATASKSALLETPPALEVFNTHNGLVKISGLSRFLTALNENLNPGASLPANAIANRSETCRQSTWTVSRSIGIQKKSTPVQTEKQSPGFFSRIFGF